MNTGNGLGEHACPQGALVLSPTALLSLRPCARLPRTTKNSSQKIFQPPRFPHCKHPVDYCSSVLARVQLRSQHSSKSAMASTVCRIRSKWLRLYFEALFEEAILAVEHPLVTHTHTHTNSLPKCSPNTRVLLVLILPLLTPYLPCKIHRQNLFVTTAFPSESAFISTCLYTQRCL